METPDFTGLHGKKLINKHLAWQKRARKAGATFEKVRYAGLSIDQATEMYQHYEKEDKVPQLVLTVILLLFSGGSTIATLPYTNHSIYHILGDVALTVFLLILCATEVISLVRVRNTATARRAYIKATDERLTSARHRSGIIPLFYTACFIFAAGSILLMLTPDSPNLKLTPLAGAGIALYITAAVQFLVAIVSYLIMRRR